VVRQDLLVATNCSMSAMTTISASSPLKEFVVHRTIVAFSTRLWCATFASQPQKRGGDILPMIHSFLGQDQLQPIEVMESRKKLNGKAAYNVVFGRHRT
jgi:hypothetical protein